MAADLRKCCSEDDLPTALWQFLLSFFPLPRDGGFVCVLLVEWPAVGTLVYVMDMFVSFVTLKRRASNPGPVRFPCSVCFKPVRVNQRALQCDVCAYWCHCVCCGVDQHRYVTFQNANEFNWLCPKCVADEMPFHDCSFLSSKETSDNCSSFGSPCNVSSGMLQLDLPPLSSTAGLRVAHLNCRSLLSIADEVSDLIVHNSIDVFAVTETWLDSSIEDCEIFPYSFPINIVRNDRNRHGGGVAFLLTPRVKFVVRSDLCESAIESLWIELYPSTKRSMLFCCVYRPPSQHNFFDNFLAECETAFSHSPRLAIFGDVNADLLVPSLPQTKLLLSIMKQFNFVDLVCAPTRVKCVALLKLMC